MQRKTSDLASLAIAARKGDREAFVLLVEAVRPTLWARALKHVPDPCRAEDLLQETCVRAYRKLATFRKPEAVLSWMLTILDRLAARERRRERVRCVDADDFETRGDERGTDASCDDALDWQELTGELRAAVMRLASADREILALRFGAGLTGPEIAKQLGMTSAGVRKRISRSVNRLREMLKVNHG